MKQLALIATLGILLGANWALRVDPAKRNLEFFPNMVRPVAVESFSGEMRAPVPGTIVYHARTGPELTNPFPRDVDRGAVVYGNYCQPCHGPAGRGDGLVAQRGFPTPPSLLAPNARNLPDAQLFRIITNGQKNMPSYAAQIDKDDRWRAVAYVRSLQQKEPK